MMEDMEEHSKLQIIGAAIMVMVFAPLLAAANLVTALIGYIHGDNPEDDDNMKGFM